ncbi:hypothetical protein CDAR_59441 [Caerostris darwini]|uniref:Uncharacterized protein n=1 Tax=Caerostris darwini TaxID=1538125 RepID=A0AAV4X2E9_9ARAC|nr:hypothetical protein CDAR_59441 [Caerostris darwini]
MSFVILGGTSVVIHFDREGGAGLARGHVSFCLLGPFLRPLDRYLIFVARDTPKVWGLEYTSRFAIVVNEVHFGLITQISDS